MMVRFFLFVGVKENVNFNFFHLIAENYFAYFRGKRQLSTKCNAYEYQCLDGTCIEDYLQCNGVADCPDRSDETLAACQSY